MGGSPPGYCAVRRSLGTSEGEWEAGSLLNIGTQEDRPSFSLQAQFVGQVAHIDH